MGQCLGLGHCLGLVPLTEATPDHPIVDTLVAKPNSDWNRYIQKNSKLIKALNTWAIDEFHDLKYDSSQEQIIEIERRCKIKLDEEWNKFGFYLKHKEMVFKLCTWQSIVISVQKSLKNRQNLTCSQNLGALVGENDGILRIHLCVNYLYSGINSTACCREEIMIVLESRCRYLF